MGGKGRGGKRRREGRKGETEEVGPVKSVA